MINSIVSKFKFNQESKEYSRYCSNSFHLGYLVGCIYINHEIENKFNLLQFQYVETREFKKIKYKFFELLKKSGVKDDKSGIVLSYLSMIEGLKNGIKNQIKELAKEWTNHSRYCDELFLTKFHIDIKNEYLALCDDKAAFLILRKDEFELHEKYVDEVESRIRKREDLLNQQDKKIIEFSFSIADELKNKILFSLANMHEDKFLILKISSLIMYHLRVITASGSFSINEKMVKEFKKINNIKEPYQGLSYDNSYVLYSPFDGSEETKLEENTEENFDIKFNGYLTFSMSLSHNLKHLKKDINGNFISTEENNFKLIDDFNKLIFDDDAIRIENKTALSILSYVDTRVRNLNM